MSTLAAAPGQPALADARRRRLPLVIPLVIVFAWLLAIAAEATGRAALLHGTLDRHVASAGSTTRASHSFAQQLLFSCSWKSHAFPAVAARGAAPVWVALALFLVTWQVMIMSMMLPSSLPLVRMFAATSREHEHPGAEMAAFLGGYLIVWTAFGAAAFAGSALLHDAVDRSEWMLGRPWLIAGSVLGVAGAFQFSSLKERCVEQCRHPGAYLLRFYRGAGARGAFRLGCGHGLFCLGCCWALMLVGIAAGMANLWWMVALTALMYFEKTRPRSDRLVATAGFALIGLAVLVFAHPAWLPAAFGSA